jgi:IPT/TIG domain-containing protein
MPDLESAEAGAEDGNRWLVPSWVASVNSTAHRLTGELSQTCCQDPPSDCAAIHETVAKAIDRAVCHARRPGLIVRKGPFKRSRSVWRRIADWWTGGEVDQAWAELHTAAQALLAIQAPAVVKSQLADMAATVVTALDPGDLRRKDYLKTLELLAPACRGISPADRAQLRAIRQACDSSSDGGHADARAFRNTLVLAGSLLAAVLATVAIIAGLDPGFRSIFAAAQTQPGGWYVFELELIASLSGLTGAVLSLQNYTGFQYSYGLPFVQAFLKATTGAATGLFGVLLVRSGITGTLTLKPGASTFAVAIVFGYAQYLFTRLIDKQANTVLKSAGSRSDPGITPTVPPGSIAPVLLTTNAASCPQVSSVSPNEGPAAGGTSVRLGGSGFAAATAVNFGSHAANDVTIDSDTQITVTSPAGNGIVAITVTTPVGTSPGSAATQFNYTPAPAEEGEASHHDPAPGSSSPKP